MVPRWLSISVFLVGLLHNTNGFVLPQPKGSPVAYNTLVSSLTDAIITSPNNEASRKFRRTVYDFKDWPPHRSTERFSNGVRTFFSSQINRGLFKQMYTIAAVATFTVVWNALAGGYVGLDMVHHAARCPYLPTLVLPLPVFTLTSGSLGLLLGESSAVCGF